MDLEAQLAPFVFAAGYLVRWADAGVIAFVTELIATEKTLPWRRIAPYGTAIVLLALGVLVVAAPDSLPAFTVPGHHPMLVMTPMGS